METNSLVKLLTNEDALILTGNPQWGQILVLYIERAMVHAGTYSSHEIFEHLGFFINTIAPNLGPGPLAVGGSSSTHYQPRYPSSMTNDQTPFELSLCWKHPKQEGKPIVRFITDIISPSAETTRAASLTQALSLIEALKNVAGNSSSPLTLRVLPELWKRISERMKALELTVHPLGSCTQCSPSSTFIGFDLVGCVISSKFYWLLPACMSVLDILEAVDRIFTACASIHDFFGSSVFLMSWLKIRDHIRTHSYTLQPRMLSVDATSFPAPRIKLYARCRFRGERDFEAWEKHLHLNGAVTCTDDFLSTCCELWTSLVTSPKQWACSRPGAGPEYCLVLYELTAFSSSCPTNGVIDLHRKLSSKLYIMCQEIPRTDAFIAAQILRHCKMAADSSILKAFATGTKPTNTISEIGLAPRKEGTEVSIYLSPSFFARDTWAVAEDGYMTKPRIERKM